VVPKIRKECKWPLGYDCKYDECIHFKNKRCDLGFFDKPKTPVSNPYNCSHFLKKVPWLGTKHRVKRARAEGKISGGDVRDVGKDFFPIDYGKRGKKKNISQR